MWHLKTGALAAVFVFSAAAAQTGVVEGTVVDSISALGIPGASVHFGKYDATTDVSGSFRITGVEQGEYDSHAEKDGFVPYYSGSDSLAKPVRAGFGQDVTRLRIQLSPFATLRGRVLDPDGNPVAKAVVDLLPSTGVEVTGEDGTFLFRGIRPGFYNLSADPPGADAAGKSKREEIVSTWFPSAIQPELAEKLRIDGGAQLAGYTIRLRTAPVYRVRGKVLDAKGRPIPNARVVVAALTPQTGTAPTMVFPISTGVRQSFFTIQPCTAGYFIVGQPLPPVEATVAEVMTGDNGKFEFPSLRAGTFKFTVLDARPIPPDPKSNFKGLIPDAEMTATVDRDIDDLEVRLEDDATPFTLRGIAEFQGSGKIETSWRGNVMLAWEGSSRSSLAVLTADGTLHAGALPAGKYRILPVPVFPGNGYLSAVFLGDHDITGQSVYLGSGSPSIRIVYKMNGGGVRGKVEVGSNATVVLVPQSSLSGGAADYGWVFQCDTGGTYAFTSLRPGSYYAWALDVSPGKLPDTDALRSLLPNSVSVQVEEGGTITADLNVTHVE